MRIFGFQKMTLLDYPGKVACTIFTGGCNLRCPFCHNAGLVTHIDDAEEISGQEIFTYLEKRKGLIDGVCISGGEPLLQKDLADFMQQIKQMGYAIKLDTNGCDAEGLRALIDAGLPDYVAMDIKNAKNKYGYTVGIESFDITPIEKSVQLLKEGRVDYEFRTTIVREMHTEEDILSMAKWLKGAKRWCLQNFVDSGDLILEGLSAHDPQTLKTFENLAAQEIDEVCLRGI